MAKKAKLADEGRTLQSICSEILDKAGTLKQSELMEKVKAVRPDAKPGSVGQALNIWKKRKGLVKPRGTAKAMPAVATGRPRKTFPADTDGLVAILERATALAKIIDIPADKLPEVIRILS
jgi:hypothetical protein